MPHTDYESDNDDEAMSLAKAALAGPRKVKVVSGEEEQELEDEETIAASEVMAAIEAKDAGAMKTALKSFIELCGYYKPASEVE